MSTIRDHIKDEWAAFYAQHHRDRAVICVDDRSYRVIHLKTRFKLHPTSYIHNFSVFLHAARDKAEGAVYSIEEAHDCHVVDVQIEVEFETAFWRITADYTAYYLNP